MGGIYDGRCGNKNCSLLTGAIRIKNTAEVNQFTDQLMGNITTELAFAGEDFIIKRSDGLYAYQLAVVLDDAYQGVTEVVRGCDLIEATVRQESLYQLFGFKSPDWLHLPLASIRQGYKLSKQNHATPIDKHKSHKTLQAALGFLGQNIPELDHVDIMLKQAVAEFDLHKTPTSHEVIINANGDNK